MREVRRDGAAAGSVPEQITTSPTHSFAKVGASSRWPPGTIYWARGDRWLEGAPALVHNSKMAMVAHKHVVFAGAQLEAAARAVFIARGEQWTDLRAAVFAALAQAVAPLSAYSIAELASASQGRRIAANSIYRILDLFVLYNLALRIESRNAYVINVHPDCMHDCMFLLCESCGSAEHLDDDGAAQGVRTLAGQKGFTVQRQVIEVLGKCARCKSTF
jgi:Fur family transcriptional regulator, zinc uptake regulator